jgi:hypothetical protein
MKRLMTGLLSALFAVMGCAQLEDARLEGRLRRMARSAYVVSPGACAGVVHDVDYAQGFEDGYYDVASGGDGCPPALPPKKYWRATYSTPAGAEHVDAWFQGFRDGAAAATADGAASVGTIRIAAEHKHGKPPKFELQPLTPTPVAAPTPKAMPIVGPSPVRGPTPTAPESFPIFGPQPPAAPIVPKETPAAKTKSEPPAVKKSTSIPKATIEPKVSSEAPGRPPVKRTPPPAPVPPRVQPPSQQNPSPKKPPTPIPVRFRETIPQANTGASWRSLPKLENLKQEPAAATELRAVGWRSTTNR